ncbi:MAG TPA: DUF5985 family protein [Verrucomicrobiae bacterium]|nr:DUF5985 family protein [Verrucomicrobiae bacterium]
MGAAIYILGTLISATCAVLLWRGYRQGGKRLLLWSSLCFVGFAVTNLLIFVDLVIFPKTDLYVFRLVTTAISLGFLLYGLIWESNR